MKLYINMLFAVSLSACAPVNTPHEVCAQYSIEDVEQIVEGVYFVGGTGQHGAIAEDPKCPNVTFSSVSYDRNASAELEELYHLLNAPDLGMSGIRITATIKTRFDVKSNSRTFHITKLRGKPQTTNRPMSIFMTK